MSAYLIKTVEEWRVADMAAADELEATFRKDPMYNVQKCVKTEKPAKMVKGEYIDGYVVMQTTKIFNDVKEPVNDIEVQYTNI